MKVKDLIELLQQCNADDRVVVAGYEGGCDDVKCAEAVHLQLDKNTEWYYGAHEIVTEKYADCTAILIS